MKKQFLNFINKYQLTMLVGILVIMSFLLVYSLSALVRLYLSPTIDQVAEVIAQPKKQKKNIRVIDGVSTVEGKENLYPVAVNIDNYVDSWPNFGLSKASLVYETVVEGGTTRFLAFYTPDPEDEILKIGPVRSTRPYFIEIAEEYSAMLAHSGGSPEALAMLKTADVYNLEEIAWWGPDYFWRVYSRSAPHNLFTSSEKLYNAIIEWDLADKNPGYEGWKFDKKDIKGNEATEIEIFFSRDNNYDVKYIYNEETGRYSRFQGGDEHIDALNNDQIEVDNVVIQYVPEEDLIDSKGRLRMDIDGYGRAEIIRNGKMINAKWTKNELTKRTKFYNFAGDEVSLKPGSIWIEIVPQEKIVTIE